jgi:hypothetical protein
MVRLREISEPFVNELFERTPKDDVESLRAQCLYALKNSSKAVEVKLILDKGWNEYLRSLADDAMNDASLLSRKRGRGRQEKSGWKTVGTVMAAYLIANKIRSKGEIPQKAIAEGIWKMANELNEGKAELPIVDSIEDQVSEALDLIQRFDKN